jgi:hypothetical protein
LLSIRKFQVETGLPGSKREARHVAVNQKGDHYLLCLAKWFTKHKILNFSLCSDEVSS